MWMPDPSLKTNLQSRIETPGSVVLGISTCVRGAIGAARDDTAAACPLVSDL
jgi:hypothetical protein